MSSDWGSIGKISVNSYTVSGSAAATTADNMDTYFGDDPDYSAPIEDVVTSNAESSSDEVAITNNEVVEKEEEKKSNASDEVIELKDANVIEDKTFNTVAWVAYKGNLTSALPVGDSFLACFAAILIEGTYKAALEQGSSIVANRGNYFEYLSSIWGDEEARGEFLKGINTTAAKGYSKAFISFFFDKNKAGKAFVQDNLKNLGTGFKMTWDKVWDKAQGMADAKMFKSISKGKLGQILSKAGSNKLTSLFSGMGSKASSFFKTVWSKEIGVFEQYKGARLDTAGKAASFGYTGVQSFGDIMSGFGWSLGIDYVGSLAANLVGGRIKNGTWDFSAETMKYGSTALKSSTKIIFATAGQLIFGKAGKTVGTIVGSFIGEIQTKAFIDENGKIDETACAIAAGAQIVGAVAVAALYVFCASNPVGWVVGACLIVGAAIGFAVTAIIYNWDKIMGAAAAACEAVGEFVSAAVEWVGEKFTEAVEWVGDQVDAAVEWVGDQVEAAAEWVSGVYEDAKEAVVEFVDTAAQVIEDGYEAVCDWVSGAWDAVTSWSW